MYHDAQGREIEDLEMDTMRKDAREAEKPAMITGKILHEAFNATISNVRSWAGLTPVARSTYNQMATHLNTIAGLPQPCPFCAFFEKPARPIGTGNVGNVPACDVCSSGPDSSEMMLAWLEEELGGTV